MRLVAVIIDGQKIPVTPLCDVKIIMDEGEDDLLRHLTVNSEGIVADLVNDMDEVIDTSHVTHDIFFEE